MGREAGREGIYVRRYVLRSRANLNARSQRRELEGALIRVGDGYGCLQPWPELGDPPLERLLQDLAGDSEHPLVCRALAMARFDRDLRTRGRSAFEESRFHSIPSHATVPECSEEGVAEAVCREYKVVKVKGGQDYAELAKRIDDCSRRWPLLHWRIDFNETLTAEETIKFVECLTDHSWRRIDFLEDPCPYSWDAWSEIRRVTSLSLAMDNHAAPHSAADVLVVKPARVPSERFRPGSERLVVTSNMDHPLGQCFAVCEASRLQKQTGRVDHCGLQTHDLFEETEFSERLGPAGPIFRSPGGTGLGFDDLLEKLPWKLLS